MTYLLKTILCDTSIEAVDIRTVRAYGYTEVVVTCSLLRPNNPHVVGIWTVILIYLLVVLELGLRES